ncbi:MAG: hypothetical protein IPO58_19385 [Betaproteobacteria bacterium]|nr:hypothetical protein [Betaproteobacteria bacterium]
MTLTATCAGGSPVTSCAWSFTGSTACVVTLAPLVTTSVSVAASNSSGVGPAVGTIVYVTSSANAAPGNCSISQSPNTVVNPVSPGTIVRLTATCASGSPATSCAWSGGSVSTACTIDVAAPAATNSYFVTASNAYGAAPPASTTIYVIGGTAPGNCSISQSPNTAASPVSPGTNVTLTLACGSGGPVTACAWSLIGSTACMVQFRRAGGHRR